MSGHGPVALLMPKWGLSMIDGELVAWLVEDGAEVKSGDDIAEVMTEKITGVVEATSAGILRRKVAKVGETLPVGGLLGVIADPTLSENEIDDFIARFRATFVPE